MQLDVSPRAVDELKKAVESRHQEEGPDTVRVMVASQCGCGSAHFAMGFDEPETGDNRIDLGGVTLLVDPDSAPFLEGATMEYSDDLMGQGFKINSPSSGCGCGGHGHAHAHSQEHDHSHAPHDHDHGHDHNHEHHDHAHDHHDHDHDHGHHHDHDHDHDHVHHHA